MNQAEINTLLNSFQNKKDRTIVVVDFGNVEKWKNSLGWPIGIQELAKLVKHFSSGSKQLRRFYYGADYGANEKARMLTFWSSNILGRAAWNNFEVVQKPVKYIFDKTNPYGFNKKCDLDVEMSVDLIRLQEKYDNVVLFSGDGDLVYALRYLKDNYNKTVYVFGARDHIGREIIDGRTDGVIARLIHVENFEYRLNAERFKYKK